MTRSKFLRLNLRDLLKGALVAAVTAVVAKGADLLGVGPLEFESLAQLVSIGVLGGLSYVVKNLFENSSGELGSER